MWKTRLAILGFLLAIALAIVMFGALYFFGLRRVAAPPTLQTTATVLRQIQSLSELVTVKYILEKVVILEDVRWYGENRVLLVAHGVVKAGVDFQRLRPEDLQLRGTNVVVTLPPVQITDAYLDDRRTRVIERSTGLLRAFDKDLEQEARRQAVDDIQRAARQGGILQDAEDRARLQVRSLFQQMGLQVEFR